VKEPKLPHLWYDSNFLRYGSGERRGQSLEQSPSAVPTGDTWSYEPLQVVGRPTGAALAMCTVPNP